MTFFSNAWVRYAHGIGTAVICCGFFLVMALVTAIWYVNEPARIAAKYNNSVAQNSVATKIITPANAQPQVGKAF